MPYCLASGAGSSTSTVEGMRVTFHAGFAKSAKMELMRKYTAGVRDPGMHGA